MAENAGASMILRNMGIVIPNSLQLYFYFIFFFDSLLCIQPGLLFFLYCIFLVHRPIDWEHGTYLRLVNFFLFITSYFLSLEQGGGGGGGGARFLGFQYFFLTSCLCLFFFL